MTCPDCGSVMDRARNGAYLCPACWNEPEPVRPEPADRAPVTGDPCWAALKQLQERIAKLESTVADLRRAAHRPPKGPPQFLGETAEEPRPGEPDETRETR